MSERVISIDDSFNIEDATLLLRTSMRNDPTRIYLPSVLKAHVQHLKHGQINARLVKNYRVESISNRVNLSVSSRSKTTSDFLS